MLVTLNVQNVALIEQASLTFGPGLHVFTGETGAGKSLLMDALHLVLGARADKDMVRLGSDKARVEAVFDLADSPNAKEYLMQQELMEEAETQVFICREITPTRMVCRINGQMVSLSQLRQLGSHLMDVHTQHEQQALLDEEMHLTFLDKYLGQSIGKQKDALALAFNDYQQVTSKLKQNFGTEQDRERRMDILRYQIREISSAKIEANEEEELLNRRSVLQHAERIIGALYDAYDCLYDGQDNVAALSQVHRAVQRLSEIDSLGQAYGEMTEKLREIHVALEDVCLQLREEKNGFEVQPGELDAVEERLEALSTLKRKYGGSIEAVLAFLKDAQQQLELIENSQEVLQQLQQELKKCMQAMQAAAEELTAARKQGAVALCQQVTNELSSLGFVKAWFEIEFTTLPPEQITLTGQDRIRFLIAPNVGEGTQSLAKTASGGEVARIMLALKTVFSDVDGIASLVFDEIDTGVSGQMAQVVATKLSHLSQKRQVLCVTHLTQMAAMAHTHWLVEKAEEGGRTVTRVRPLQEDERIVQLAQMGSGHEVSASALAHAKEMLSQNQNFRNS